MQFVRLIFIMLGCLLGLVGPSHAQATRTWVSGVGDDANPCSRTAPCKTFAGAISKTAAAGEINCLDSGGFGVVTITKSITLYCEGVVAGVLASGATNAILVNAAPTDRVVLSGLDIDGAGTGNNGITVVHAGIVQIERCLIRGFTAVGVNVISSSATRVTISDSSISFTAGGVNVKGTNIANSANINNTLLDGNSSFGVQGDGSGNAISLFHSTILGSTAGVSVLNGAVVVSRGPSNVINGTKTGLTMIGFD